MVETCIVDQIDAVRLQLVEADCYWGLTKLLDGIQDNYTFASPGIQKNVKMLRELVSRLDKPLQLHLEQNNIEYLQVTAPTSDMHTFAVHHVCRRSSMTYFSFPSAG